MKDINKPITVRVMVNKSLSVVWHHLVNPESIKQWNQASDDWETTEASVDLKVGGIYFAHMQAKDGSFGFDFKCVFQAIEHEVSYTYVMEEENRVVNVTLTQTPEGVLVEETFDPETENPIEMQREGWQAILNSFKQYVESINH